MISDPDDAAISATRAVRASDQFAASRRQNERARRTLAGGVATAFRSAQKPVPICFKRAQGSRLTDEDDNEYIDYALAFGPMLLGHSPEPVLQAVQAQLAAGLGYGASHHAEAELAEAVCRAVPSADLCVFSNSGSEAVHAAVRIARSATRRTKLVKFRGHYHGWLDPVHVALPGNKSDGPATGGQDPAASTSTILCDWNDLPALSSVLSEEVAAVIMEPLAVNGGCIQADPGYLDAARGLVHENGSLLIFDEIITGFRLALGGAQEYYEVQPDLTVLGKALGSGFPISAVCGRGDIMEEVVASRVAHVGTFNANPICATAALAAIETLEEGRESLYPQLTTLGSMLADAIRQPTANAGLAVEVNQVGGVACAWIDEKAETPMLSYGDFAAVMLEYGVHLIPRGLIYISTAHSELDVMATREAAGRAAEQLLARV
jgi:glutamate-1-semialdehyde 2,1-aminomutase